MTCKDCKWFDAGIPTRPEGFCKYGFCSRHGEDVGPETSACDPWFEDKDEQTKIGDK